MAKAKVSFDVSGTNKLTKNLLLFPKRFEGNVVRTALRNSMKKLEAKAEAKAPVGTEEGAGGLKKRIKVKSGKRKRGKSSAFVVSTGDDQSPTQPLHVEYGTKHTPAQPYLRPAFDENVESIQAEMLQELKAGLEKEIKKLKSKGKKKK